MPTKKAAAAPADPAHLLARLDHPLKPVVLALRETILAADPSIGEEVKWNAPSFRTTEHFATMHLRAKDAVQLILHFGARKRDVAGVAIADPAKLLTWLGDDRATLRFADVAQLQAQAPALQALLRDWIRHV